MTSSLHVWKNSIHPSIHDQTSNGHKSVMSPNQQYPLTDDLHNTDQKILGLGNSFRLNFGMYHIPKHCWRQAHTPNKGPQRQWFLLQDNVLHRTANVVSNGLKENHKEPKMEID